MGSVHAALGALVRRLDADRRLAGVVRWVRTMLGGGGETDPLSFSPQLASHLAARLAAVAEHRPSVLGELGLTALQLWRVHAGTGRDIRAGELTVVFTDLSRFSDWTLQVGDETAVRALRRVHAAIEPPITAEGTLVKRLGDGLMAAFADPQAAVAAVIAARDAVAALDLDGHRLALRAGVHTGRPTPLGGDYYGQDVNVAARLTETAGPGEVCISDATRRRLGDLDAHGWRLGEQRTLHAHGVPTWLTSHPITHDPSPGDTGPDTGQDIGPDRGHPMDSEDGPAGPDDPLASPALSGSER
jgi:adenylate cyclase